MKLSEKYYQKIQCNGNTENLAVSCDEIKIYGEICRLEEKYIWRRAMGARVSAEQCIIQLKKISKENGL